MEYSGLTGELYLDQNGQRTNFKLDLLEKSRDNMVKTGIWHPEIGVNYTRTSEEGDAIVFEQLQNKTLRVTTAFVSLKEFERSGLIFLHFCFFSFFSRTHHSLSRKNLMSPRRPWKD